MRKVIYITLLLVCTTTLMNAVEAYHGEITFKQKDGSRFNGKLKGDEWFHWIEDTKGNTIVYNLEKKTYEYGLIKKVNGVYDLVPSGIAVATKAQKYPAQTLSSNLGKIDRQMLYRIWQRKREEAFKKTKEN